MTRRNIFILVALIFLTVSGFSGCKAWQDQKRKQALIDIDNTTSCSPCSFSKKDLAEKVEHNKQKAKQANESLSIVPNN